MKTVTFAVASRSEVMRRARQALAGEKQEAHITFASAELLFSLMTAKRWDVVRAMAGAGPMSLRALARRLDRDVKSVHGDVHALLDAGILQKDVGRIVFPFEAVHVDVVIRAA
jgi:predicted transcriptional regulator